MAGIDDLENILDNFNDALDSVDDGDSSAVNPLQTEILNLSSGDPKLVDKALREVINASTDERDRNFLSSRDAIPPIIKILATGSNDTLRWLAAHALANLALDVNGRSKINSSGGISAILNSLSSTNEKLKERALATIANLTIEDDSLRQAINSQGGCSKVSNAIGGYGDGETVATGLMAMANLAVNPSCAANFISSGAVAKVLNFLNGSNPKHKKYALWVLAAFSSQASCHSQLEGHIRAIGYAINGSDANDTIKSLTVLVNISGSVSTHYRIIEAGLMSGIISKTNGGEINAKILSLQIIQNMSLSDQGRGGIRNTGRAGDIAMGVSSLPEDLVVHGLRAMTNSSQDDQIRQALAANGGLQTAERFLNSFNADVKEAASQAVNNLRV